MSDKKQPAAPARSVKKGTALITLLILCSLAWYLVSDRFTPYTQQARIQGFVVGVAPKVAGVVTAVWVKNDQQVEAEQLLFEIDRAQYEIALKRAHSDLQKVQYEVGAGGAGIESAKGNLRSAIANETKAKQDAERLERLYKEDPGAISVRRVEVARATLEQAHANVSVAEAEIERATEQKGGEGESNAQLKSALSAVAKAKLDLGNTLVKASSNGVITDLRAEVGQFASAGKPVMTLVATDNFWINAEFTENNLGHLRVGTPVAIVVDILPGRIFEGKVTSIGLGVAATQPPPAGSLPTIENNRDWLRQSQRFPVVIKFDPKPDDQLKGHLRIGGQVEVMAFTEGHGMLKFLGQLYIRMMSWFSYAY